MTKPKKNNLTLAQILSKIVNSGIKESNLKSKNNQNGINNPSLLPGKTVKGNNKCELLLSV